MDQTARIPAPYFDFDTLSLEMAALAERHAGQETALRAAMADRFRPLIAEAYAQAERQLASDGDGVRCSEDLSLFQDALIRLAYETVTKHVYRVENPSSSERMAIVATGGYGRGRLAPGSDIDLMFLLPYKQTAWGESVGEFILYLLWDLGFKVGHATRSVDQCVRLSFEDMTIRSALLDARRILGDEALFAEFRQRFWKDVLSTDPVNFIEAKLEERRARYAKSGASRYRVEPNIKEGKGGLRDLHTLHWLAKHLHPDKAEADFVAVGIFTQSEYSTFVRCERFLWTVRCHLHFLTGKAEDRLSFDLQQRMAERLHYRSHNGLRAVERFMKHYFLVAKEVGDLTAIVCTALEMKQLKSLPVPDRLLAPFGWKRRNQLGVNSDFRIEWGRLFAEPDVFKKDRLNILRLFVVADQHQVNFAPSILRLLRANLRLIDDGFRNDPEANKLFLQLLTESRNVEAILRKMNEAGVLGRFIPDFGRVVSMMQFNMYHHFTVDEHLIRTLGYLAGIERGDYAEEHPLSTELIGTIDNRRALYVAALLHDIAKGREEDHSIAGAEIAHELCPRLGLSKAETETVAWLVEHHLDMSSYAQSRDLSDPKTIRAFADLVQSRERLKLLLVLTVADISAVGPGVWTGWKGQLLRTLYFETAPLLGGGHVVLSRSERIDQAKEALRDRLKDWPAAEVDAFLDKHNPDYWLRTDLDLIVEHAKLVREASEKGERLATHISTDAFQAVTQISILAPNHPRLLSMIAGACHKAGADIADAQISTTRDDLALDTIHLQRQFDYAEDEERRAARIAKTIESLLRGETRLQDVVAERRKAQPQLAAFTVEPQVVIDNTLSDNLTVIEINGLDRPGLLYDITTEFARLNLDIATAHIATFGERAVDVFYLTDLTGQKVKDPKREAAIREGLTRVLRGPQQPPVRAAG